MRGLEAHHLARFHEPAFQLQNALAGSQSRLQFIHMERLREIVVRARLQAGHDVLFRFFRRQQNHVNVSLLLRFLLPSHCPANSGPSSSGITQSSNARRGPSGRVSCSTAKRPFSTAVTS